jgi:hypothetical protein
MDKTKIRKYEDILRRMIRDNPCDTAIRVLLIRCLMIGILDGSDFLMKSQKECLDEANFILLLSLNPDEIAYARYIVSICRRFGGETVVSESERERGQKALKLLRKIQPCAS